MSEPTLIEFTTEEGLRPVGVFRRRDELTEKSDKAMDKAMYTISSMARNMQKALGSIGGNPTPDDIEVEFGLKFDIELGAIIAKTSNESSIKVKMRWASNKEMTK